MRFANWILATLGADAENLASTTPNPLATTFAVAAGGYWQSTSLTLDIDSEGELALRRPRLGSCNQQHLQHDR